MIEHGADIKSQLQFDASKTDLAMAQLLQYNCYGRYREGAATYCHSKDRETPSLWGRLSMQKLEKDFL